MPPVGCIHRAYYNSVVAKGNKFPSTLLSKPDIKAEIELPYHAGAQGLVSPVLGGSVTTSSTRLQGAVIFGCGARRPACLPSRSLASAGGTS